MVIAVALSIFAAVIALGAVNQDFILLPYGLAAIAVLGWVGKLFFGKAVCWKSSPVHWPVLGFFVYALVRYFTSPIEYESRLELLNVGFYAIVYFLCAANFYHTRDRVFLLVPAQAFVANWLQSFREFPPRQKPASFSLDQVMEKLVTAGPRAN
jgi:hypothetical protein